MQAAMAGLGFVLPFSPAGVAWFMAALLVVALCSLRHVSRTAAWREPTAAIGLLLFAYIALHTAVAGPWTLASVGSVNKYHELLFFPVLLALFAATSRPRAFLWGLGAGTLAYALAHWVAPWFPALSQELAPKRISAGFCLALAAYLMLHQGGRFAWMWRGIAAVLAATVLFRIEGRTGHVVLMLLAIASVWNLRPGRWRMPAAVGACVALVLVAFNAPPVQTRMKETLSGLSTMRMGAETSTSIRLALLANGWTIAAAHQPLGVGFSRYAEFHEPVARRRLAQEPDWNPQKASWEVFANNPHNEYLMQLACGGVPALALLLAWIAAAAFRRDASGRAPPALTGLVLAFAVGCLFNSLVMDFVEGHFYTVVLAWLLAGERRAAAPPPVS
ncbi:hypothetical protein EZ313_21455 [Ramlibacter henchirensis]|uniref:O-antigen ligase-related domain-containing protein n=1 Tax=Ramlibacter henchirensis TaxID=204072 RepID=A0A4Z0BK35_9BURK|nr:O-antigen ligase family protein [Ramlibacter henchirensis]TFY99141.1 hypothetical protein EZ313_21455 [Ramlibacter henchirensis]